MTGAPAMREPASMRGPRMRQQVWTALRQGRPVGIPALVQVTKASTSTVRAYVDALSRGGYVTRAVPTRRPKGGQPYVYTLARDVGVDAPHLRPDGSEITASTAQDRAWAAMKAMPDFTARSLAYVAQATPEGLAKWLAALVRHGLLMVVARARSAPGGSQTVYRFVRARDLGPRAPLPRGRGLWDTNRHRAVPLPESAAHG